jgi:hypothetical protein
VNWEQEERELFTIPYSCSPFSVSGFLPLRSYVLHNFLSSFLSAAAKVPGGATRMSAEMFSGAHDPSMLHVMTRTSASAFDLAAAGLHFTLGAVVIFLRVRGHRRERQDQSQTRER